MSNTITGLLQYIFDTADVVSRELVGFIPSVYLNAKAEQVALNQDVTYPVVPAATAASITPAATPPALADTTYGTGTMTLSKAYAHRFHWTGEDEAAIGQNMKNILQNNKFAQGFRVLTNLIEADLAALYLSSSRAYGTPGVTPFGTAGDFSDAAEVVRILKDNGAPQGDMQLVVNTAAGAKMIGKQSRADIVGANVGSLQQQGILLALANCKIRESAQVNSVTKGTGANYQVNKVAGYAVGDTSIDLDTGAGTMLAGDVIKFDGDDNLYVVATALNAGTVVIAAPGLRKALVNDTPVTIQDSYAANMAFDRSAIHLLSRLPKTPEGGDIAQDEYTLVDPVSGIPYRIALYKGYHANQIEISTAWGVKAVKTAHMALLLG